MSAELHVADFGAVGNGTTDDGPALQAALDAASVKGAPLRFGAQAYGTKQMLVVQAQLELLGSSGTGDATSIRALSAMDAIMEFNHPVRVSQITFDGRFKADYCGKFINGSRSLFQTCNFLQARIDGAFLDNTHGNFFHHFQDTLFQWNGTTYQTPFFPGTQAVRTKQVVASGTVATTIGSCTLVGTGTSFLSELADARSGDFITVGETSPEWFQLFAVKDDTTLIIMSLQLPTLTRSGQGYRVGIGDGYHEKISSNNNNNNLDNCRAFGNAGVGLMCRSLFGIRVSRFQGDYNNAYAINVGHGNEGVVLNSCFRDLYFENNGADAAIFLSYANGITIDCVISDVPVVKSAHEAFATGMISNDQNDHGKTLKPIGPYFTSEIPTAILAPNVLAQGAIIGESQFSGGRGNGSLTIKDQDGATPGWSAISGSLNDATAVAFDLQVKQAFVTAGATVLRLRNGATVVLRADLSGNLRLAGSLGVGNSAAGSTPGSVVRKIEVFDALGASLGFIPVYDLIA